MRSIKTIYENIIGITFELLNEEKKSIIVLEIGSVSFMINHKELSNFIKSMEEIISHYKNCNCSKDLKNKMVVYQADCTEIRMKLSYDELFLLKDLLKGTKFKLEMDDILNNYRIK
ncbi:hypothetical protein QVZ41_07335 [Wenyingzhuangia sp. chi5]|uniref:Uncharacterized protein n=1 Tax=Wenyingzhuangia gilva TaxID=3057677 RepID=A0ABT8VRR5_9FLAO|nr:hypothetical protein [Wenyingzhuangia sp. chi5]MDO3694657.1 hypothetical protein [Wenyingzhuangia sp. chi5]